MAINVLVFPFISIDVLLHNFLSKTWFLSHTSQYEVKEYSRMCFVSKPIAT